MNTLPVPTQPQHPDYVTAEPVDSQPQASPIKLNKLLFALGRLWWVPVLTLILGLAGAGALAFWVYKNHPNYVSRASFQEVPKLRLPDGDMFVQDRQTVLGTQSDLLRHPELRRLTLEKLASGTNSVVIPQDSIGEAAEVSIKVLASPKSLIYTIEANGQYPDYTRVYLNTLMEVYLEHLGETRRRLAGDAFETINKQVTESEDKWLREREAFREFQTNNAIVQQEASIAGTYLATLNSRLAELDLEDRLLSASIAAVQTATNAAAAGSVPGIIPPNPTPEQVGAFREIEALSLQRKRLARFLKDKHPKMVKLDSDIARGRQLLAMYQQHSLAQMELNRQNLASRRANIEKQINDWKPKVTKANGLIAEEQRFRLDLEFAQRVYERTLALRQSVDLTRKLDLEAGTLSVLRPASEPERTYTREISIAGVGGVAGLGFGLAIILLVAWRDNRFSSVRDVTETFGGGVIGQVPEVAFKKKAPLQLRDRDQEHMYAESYRNLRSALLYLALGENKPKVILVTSAVPNEGKSTIATNLAKSLALGGDRVLLVDGDLRKGSLGKMLGLKQTPGFAELLHKSADFDLVYQSNSLPNLSILTSGRPIGNAGDLFIGKTIDELLSRWRNEFDHVVIDSTPVFAADDAATLAPKVDGTLLVVRNRFTRAPQVREAIELLLQRQAKILGLVYNRANPDANGYYYYKYKEYYAQKA